MINADTYYNDLASIKQVRDYIERAKKAQLSYKDFDQAKVDRVIEAMAGAGYDNAHKLAVMAVEETGIGVVKDKL